MHTWAPKRDWRLRFWHAHVVPKMQTHRPKLTNGERSSKRSTSRVMLMSFEKNLRVQKRIVPPSFSIGKPKISKLVASVGL